MSGTEGLSDGGVEGRKSKRRAAGLAGDWRLGAGTLGEWRGVAVSRRAVM